MRQEVIIGVERRRRWTDAEKASILSEIGISGATATQIAARHDLSRQQLYRWRHELHRKGYWDSDPRFLAINVVPDSRPPEAPASSARSIEIMLRNGRSLRVPSNITDDDVSRLIRLVEAA
jgi:transposase